MHMWSVFSVALCSAKHSDRDELGGKSVPRDLATESRYYGSSHKSVYAAGLGPHLHRQRLPLTRVYPHDILAIQSY